MGIKRTISMVLAFGAIFWWFVPLVPNLSDTFQTIITAMSIVVAAILVRLNRGMPTLDWKSLNIDDRERLTREIVNLTRDYIVILATNCLFLLIILTLAIEKPVLPTLSPEVREGLSGLIGGLVALCVARMGYVVWRDYDIVKLQKTLIDASGRKEHDDEQIKQSDKKVANIKSNAVLKIAPTEPNRWGD